MRAADGYCITSLKGQTYIMPFGQNIVAYRHSLKVNETGIFLWNQLQTECTLDQLIQAFVREYQIEDTMLTEVRSDITEFVTRLEQLHMLDPANSMLQCHQQLAIADCHIDYYGPMELFHPNLKAFRIHSDSDDDIPADGIPTDSIPIDSIPTNGIPADSSLYEQTWIVQTCAHYRGTFGKLLIETPQIRIYESPDHYIMEFLSNTAIKECLISTTQTPMEPASITLYCHSLPLSCDPTQCQSSHRDNTQCRSSQCNDMNCIDWYQTVRDEAFHAFRFGFLTLVQQNGFFALHSASLLYQDKAWLFSAPSGTGKSTHTNLWNTLHRTLLLNGDLNLCTIKNGTAYVYGIPWCGTSGIYLNDSYPIGGIVLLKQEKQDFVETLSIEEQILSVSQRLISPTWTPAMLQSNLTFTERLTELIRICRLHCTKEESAVTAIKEYIDK